MKKKRLLSAALALCMLFGSAAALPEGFIGGSAGITASATYYDGDCEFEDTTGGLEFSCYNGTAATLQIPSSSNGKSVVSIGSSAFLQLWGANTSLTTIKVPSSVKTVKASGFYSCLNLTKVEFANGVQTISKYAFAGCPKLTSVNIPQSVTSLHSQAFYSDKASERCSLLTSITVDANNSTYAGYDGAVYNKAKTTLVCYPYGKTSINIPGTVDTVPGKIFGPALTSVTLNEGIKSLDAWMCINCKNMKSITIPKSVTSIGAQAVGYYHANAENDDPETKISNFIIYGYKGTAAETYANSNGFKFVALDTGCSHTYGNPTWTWSGYTAASAKFTCTKCSASQTANASSITNTVTKAATCSATGVRTYTATASFGGKSYTNTKTETIAINSNAHTWNTTAAWTWTGYSSATAKVTCKNNSSHVQSANATITSAVTKAATCSATGVRTYTATATVNGTKFTDTKTETIAINSNAHSWNAPTYTWSSDNKTCTATRVCASNSSHKQTETATASVSTTAATCTTAGSTTYTATFQNSAFAKQTKSVTSAALGHSWTTKTVAPTCEKEGYTEKVCSRCKESQKSDYKAALGHSFSNTVVKPTCTAKGYTLHKCTRTGCTYSYQSDYTDKVDHTWGAWQTVKPATATTTGTKKRVCTVCNTVETGTIPVTTHTHNYTTKVVAPTCTAQGYTLHTCSGCGDSYKDTYKAAAGHSYNNTVYPPTPIKQGYTVHKCTKCTYSYTDSYTAKATIRLFGQTRVETSFKIADQIKKEKGGAQFKSVIIASGTSFADALSATYLAKVKNNGSTPILLVTGEEAMMNSVVSYIKQNSVAGATVYIIGGKGAVKETMESKLTANGLKPVRLQGGDRYTTNIAVLKEAGVTNQELLVASGLDYADALSASAVGKPIFLVGKTGLSSEQQAYLKTLKSTTATVIGGTGPVPAVVENQVRAIIKGGSRIGGADRYETSVLVARKYFSNPNPPAAVLAYGLNYPDGLCGGVIAMTYSCPLILTTNNYTTEAKKYFAAIGASSAVVLGGTTLISDLSVKNIVTR